MRKNLVLLLSGALLMAACGNNTGDTKPTASTDTATTAAPAATAASDKGLELIGASDCTTCHSLHKGTGSSIGPAYEDVAAKYSPAADTTVNRLVKKITTGGSGVWGTTPMTPHPALKEDDVHTMVTYILSLKK
ncbi:MAG TPA: c-type cytochrome [Puia sp.]|jgi:cytochrome c|nr:c-type cytochrome [Puia sp.]